MKDSTKSVKILKYSKGITKKPGVYKTGTGYNFAFVAKKDAKVELLFYSRSNHSDIPDAVIELTEENRFGNVYSVYVTDRSIKKCLYNYRVDGAIFADPYSRAVFFYENTLLKSCVDELSEFDWQGDERPHIPFEETIIYRMHVKGFTAGYGSKVKCKGTFKGIMDKIPYLKELGITAVELLPIHEFTDKNPNYWGYAGGYYFSPGLKYSSDKKCGGQVRELKTLVRELHKNKIELILEQYYTQDTNPSLVIDAIKYWVEEYHIDGIHMITYNDVEKVIAGIPELSDVKIFGNNWWNINFDNPYIRDNRNLAEYNDSFKNNARKFLKGDENQLDEFIQNMRANPRDYAKVNYITHTNGFTLMDMVSYDYKHNEENGENNRDGEDFNYSWNCGYEGPTRNRKVLALRLRQMKNAMSMLFLAQSIPMLLAGDEFGNSQNGNNNPYGLDNQVTWLDWRNLKKNSELFKFTKNLIHFRREHGVLHQKDQLKLMDYMSTGLPDLSYHSEKAWYPAIEVYKRHIGMLLCGNYSDDNNLYIAYNMHWEPHELAIPGLENDENYEVCINTGDNEPVFTDKSIIVEPRSVVVLTSRADRSDKE